MTLEQTVEMLREFHALTMLEAVITQTCEAPDWKYALAAITDNRRWCAYLLSLEPPEVIAVAHDLLDADMLTTPRAEPSTPAPLIALDVPTSALIH